MITHDSTFEALAVAPVKQTDVEVAKQIIDPYGSIDDFLWTSDDALMSVKVDSVGSFLGTATKKAVVKLLGIVDTAAEGDLFQIRTGLYDDNTETFNYISQGFFFVDEIEFNYEDEYTLVTMYDHMWAAKNTQYIEAPETVGLTFPATVEELAGYMASAINAELMSGFSALPNADYTIEVDPYLTISNATIQNVIQEIAGATGTTARMTDTTLTFVQYSVDDENLDADSLKKLTIGEQYGPVTSVIFGRVPQNDNIVIASVAPEASEITNVDTGTDLLTVVANAMADGNLVRVESTGTLPAPLEADTNYYVYTNGDPDTFALADNYDDAVAGTNLINITSAGSGTISLSHLPTQEVQINNNQIVDDDRATLLEPVYAQLVGIEWSEVEADTVGLGWHEVGDVIQYTQGSTTVKSLISEIHLVFEASIKEQLKSEIPDVATINYQTAGGILKTIYNTEIKVDKQENEIISIVSQQDVYEDQTTENFTQIQQDLDDISLTIQKSGNGNLILNSVGFATESAEDNSSVAYDHLTFWDYNVNYDTVTDGVAVSYSSSESQNNGGVSGQVIEMAGADISLSQRVSAAANTPLSFGIRVNNAIGTGEATITLSNDNETFQIDIDNATAYEWTELTLEDFSLTLPWLDVEIVVNAASSFAFTDLRLMYGSTLPGWTQATSEILGTNVQFSEQGMKIYDNVHDTETRVTYNEFSTRRRSDGAVLFEADDTGIVANDFTVKGRTSYYKNGEEVIRQLTIPNSSDLAGVAFVRVS